jgi:hypothetical protein
MNPLFFLFALLPLFASAQHVVTFDPEKDPIARRSSDGTIQFVVPARAVAVSIQESVPQIIDIQSIGIQKFGKSSYVIASGWERNKPGVSFAVAVLLAETSPGSFQADNLVISCSSAGDCRECSLPPLCNCSKGEGTCSQNSTWLISLKKITVTLLD